MLLIFHRLNIVSRSRIISYIFILSFNKTCNPLYFQFLVIAIRAINAHINRFRYTLPRFAQIPLIVLRLTRHLLILLTNDPKPTHAVLFSISIFKFAVLSPFMYNCCKKTLQAHFNCQLHPFIGNKINYCLFFAEINYSLFLRQRTVKDFHSFFA